MLKIVHPPTYIPERAYILRVILKDWLGLEFVEESAGVGCLQITRLGDPAEGKLEVSDAFFSTPRGKWLTTGALPTEIQSWNPAPALPGVPAPLALLYGGKLANGDYLMAQPSLVRLGVDIFGTAFFMLTRYEEVVNRQRDEFDRFAGRFSILHSAGLLERPIVNEQVELLWWALQRLWPDLVRKPRAYRCLLSCDVDNVSIIGAAPLHAFRILAGHSVRGALREGPWQSVFRRGRQFWQAWRGNPGADALDDFDFLMDQAEQHGCTFVFNFIAGHGKSGLDGIYGIHRAGIRRLMRRIHDWGHELGFHGSYESFRDPDRLREEFTRLVRIAAEEGVTPAQWGGRQHYLRWEAPTTWQAYEDAGIAYDSSLGYADHAGFRCGTCYEFPVFNLQTRQALKLLERPLIVMECSLWNQAYMGLSTSQAVAKVAELSGACRRFEGQFTLLWHNGQTESAEQRGVLLKSLDAITDPNAAGSTGLGPLDSL